MNGHIFLRFTAVFVAAALASAMIGGCRAAIPAGGSPKVTSTVPPEQISSAQNDNLTNLNNYGGFATSGDCVYYRNYADGGNLYKLNLKSAEKAKIAEITDTMKTLRICLDGERIYYLARNTALNPNDSSLAVYSVKLDGTDTRMHIPVLTMLNFIVKEGYIYYISQDKKGVNSICRLDTDAASEESREILVSKQGGFFDYLNLNEDSSKLYFLDRTMSFLVVEYDILSGEKRNLLTSYGENDAKKVYAGNINYYKGALYFSDIEGDALNITELNIKKYDIASGEITKVSVCPRVAGATIGGLLVSDLGIFYVANMQLRMFLYSAQASPPAEIAYVDSAVNLSKSIVGEYIVLSDGKKYIRAFKPDGTEVEIGF